MIIEVTSDMFRYLRRSNTTVRKKIFNGILNHINILISLDQI
jgi:hypothetical protein